MTTLESTVNRHQAIVKKAYQVFFSPSQYERKSSDQAILDRGKTYRIPYSDGELAVTTWGEGSKTVLLMHGWGGSRAQMTGFVEPLLSAGYRVISFDQPAHGESDGKITNILEISPTLKLVENREGPFEVIIAHSFGTLITSYAIVNQLLKTPSCLVYFGSFNRLLDALPRFQVWSGLPTEVIDGLRQMIFDRFGKEKLEGIVNAELTRQINVPALLFHDIDDNVTPVEDSRAIADVWAHARFIETDGLGHRGALQSRSVIEQVIDFLKG